MAMNDDTPHPDVEHMEPALGVILRQFQIPGDQQEQLGEHAQNVQQVADMKNSVADRNNAQSSCAATFIYEHMHPAFRGGWLHVDLAGPSFIEGRGTGFGVGLILALLGVEGFRTEGE